MHIGLNYLSFLSYGFRIKTTSTATIIKRVAWSTGIGPLVEEMVFTCILRTGCGKSLF